MGKSIAAVSISFPLFRFDERRKPYYVELLLAAAAEASADMGYPGSFPAASEPALQ